MKKLGNLVILTTAEYEHLLLRAEEAEERFANEQALSMARANKIIELMAKGD